MENFEKIKKFVLNQNRLSKNNKLSLNTDLRKDLKLWGDDAFEFINEYSKEFDVNISSFNISLYFPPEGDWILSKILNLLTFNTKKEYLELTIEKLIKGIEEKNLE